MKTKSFLVLPAIFFIPLLALMSRADDFNAVQNGNWSDPNTWVDNTVVTNGIVPGAADSADIPTNIVVTVDTNVSIGYIYDTGTVLMGTNSTLNVYTDTSISPTTTLITTNSGNTVIYFCNPFFAKECNYNNLVLEQTNYVQPLPPFGSPWQDFNNFSQYGPTPMTISGNMTLLGTVKVQQGSGGAPITIGGNLIIGSGSAWDCSGDVLTVVSNTYVYGLLEDLNGALGSNNFGGNVIISGASTSFPSYSGGTYTNGWYLSDVTSWYVGGSLTNNGAIYGSGFGSISFDGTGGIAGSNAITIPTMTVNGTYTIADTITLTTNTPILTGTLVFDLANTSPNTNQIILRYSPSLTSTNTTATNYYGGNLVVVNSGVAPVSGNSYKFFSASNYAGLFGSETFPTLSPGLSWSTNLFTSGSIAVTGVALGSPKLTITKNGLSLTLSWDSNSFPGFSVQAQTNSAGIHSNWFPTGSGTSGTYPTTINPAGPPVFYRLSHP